MSVQKGVYEQDVRLFLRIVCVLDVGPEKCPIIALKIIGGGRATDEGEKEREIVLKEQKNSHS